MVVLIKATLNGGELIDFLNPRWAPSTALLFYWNVVGK